MKSTVSSLKRALREAFTNKLRDLDHDSHTEPLFTQFRSTEMGVDDVTNRHNAVEPPEITVKVDPYGQDDGEPDGVEDESTSRERQQMAGYSGAVDGPMDYGYDSFGQEEHSEEMTGGMPFDAPSMDLDLDLSDDEEKEEEPESELSMNKILKGEELDDDDSDEDDGGSEEDEDSEEEDSGSEGSDEEDDGEDSKSEDEQDDDEDKDSDEDEVEEEGVSQSKRATHGYDLEEPDDYDVPHEPVKHGRSIGGIGEALGLEGDYDMDEMDSGGTNTVPGSGDGIGEDMGDDDQKNFPELSGLRNALKSVKPQDLAGVLGGGMGEAEESPVSQQKAKTIMKHGEVNDKPLSDKQKGLFGLIAGGGKPNRLK